MTRKIQRGKPITELTKGSYEYTVHTIREAFYQQFSRMHDDWFWVEECFADHLIIGHEDLPADEYYLVSYLADGGQYLFAPREEWETVELAYTLSAPLSETQTRQPFTETFSCELTEASKENEAGPWRVRGIGNTVDNINRNSRRRKRHVIQESVRRAQAQLSEAQSGKRLVLTGESDHPEDKGFRISLFSEVIVVWDTINFDGTHVLIEGNLLPTREGRDAYIRMKAGVKPDISQRSYGRAIIIDEDGQSIEEVLEEEIKGYDFVSGGADRNAFVEFSESTSNQPRPSGPPTPKEEPTMNLDELRKKYPELVAQIEAEQDEKQRALLEAQLKARAAEDKRIAEAVKGREAELRQTLGLDEGADLTEAIRQREQQLATLREADKEKDEALQAYRDAEKRQRVAAHIAEAVDKLEYPDDVKETLIDAVNALAPDSVEKADAILEAKKKEYDRLMAKVELAKRGKKDEVVVVGPVVETETGRPAFLEPARQFTERMVERGIATRRNLAEAVTKNELFTRRYLDAYDKAYNAQLIAEYNRYREFTEAQTTADLNLPYSVSRAIIEEAVPMLVALSIFDFGLEDNSPTKIYFENYSAETGAIPTVTDESFTSSADAWVQLASKRLNPGTVVVTTDPAGTTYTEYTDYLIDYANGKIMVLSTGSMSDATGYLIDYTYNAVRGGEGSSIQRGKGQLSSQTIELEADRLATQITDEAVLWARTQIGWDAQTRVVQMVIREIREMIDTGILRLAIAQAVRAANSGGSWNSSSGSLADLVKYIGLAKVAVMNDHYMPTFILTSYTNAERLSNWEGFKRDGFPDAVLNATGFVGQVKGLPLYQSVQMPDTHIVVGHPELVQYRVQSSRPMTLKGPFPSYDANGKLIASSQWYVEEYNTTESLIAEKGGYVAVT